MIKKILMIIVGFYLLTLLQTSFFLHLRLLGVIPNLVLVSVVLINILERPKEKAGLLAGFAGGFFLDVFSSGYIGFYAFIFLVLSFAIKMIFRKYVRVPVREI